MAGSIKALAQQAAEHVKITPTRCPALDGQEVRTDEYGIVHCVTREAGGVSKVCPFVLAVCNTESSNDRLPTVRSLYFQMADNHIERKYVTVLCLKQGSGGTLAGA